MVADKLSRTCFLITPLGEQSSTARRRADSLEAHLKTLLSRYNLELVRGDRIAAQGNVIRQVLREILDSTLVIADLSGANPNVMYELGFADARGLPVLRIVDDSSKLPFNFKTDRTVVLPSTNTGELVETNTSDADKLLEAFFTDALEWGAQRCSVANEIIQDIGPTGLGEVGWNRVMGGFVLGHGLNGVRRALSIAQADVAQFDDKFQSLLTKQPCNQYSINIIGATIDDTAWIDLRFGDWMNSEIEEFVTELVDLLIACRSPYEVHANQANIRVKPGERVRLSA